MKIKTLIQSHKSGSCVGICSICSAHPLVIEAGLRFDLDTNRKVLIEATSNQVNQFGGYTKMNPADYCNFVYEIADKVGFPKDRIILGGDHLGPNCWQNELAQDAMEKSKVLVAEYVKAGFTKIHLDTSMSCAGDPLPLDPFVVAERAAILCQAAENVATPEQKAKFSYVVGTEVPVPGGEAHTINTVHVTTVPDAERTITSHYESFKKYGLTDAIDRIIAIVVQPGVEFDHSKIIHYQREKAAQLSKFIEGTPLVYEAHSTDYQTPTAFKQLVEDHFAILKVGPALTFALREAIFGLSLIEKEIISPETQSQVVQVIDSVMQDEPGYWKKYYNPVHSKAMIDIHFSFSDRIRYYWPHERINNAVEKLISNLNSAEIPLGMLSQYFPMQFQRVVEGELKLSAKDIILDKIQDVLRAYAFGCDGY